MLKSDKIPGLLLSQKVFPLGLQMAFFTFNDHIQRGPHTTWFSPSLREIKTLLLASLLFFLLPLWDGKRVEDIVSLRNTRLFPNRSCINTSVHSCADLQMDLNPGPRSKNSAIPGANFAYQNISLLSNQAASLRDSWMVRESFWLTHASVAAGANAHGRASKQGITKLVICRVEGQGEGAFPSAMELFTMRVLNRIILVPDSVKGAVGDIEEKGQGPDTYAFKVCLLIPFNLYKLTTLNTYIRKQEKMKINKYPAQEVGKITPKGNKREKLVKTKAEINECVFLKQHRKTNNRPKSWILEKK